MSTRTHAEELWFAMGGRGGRTHFVWKEVDRPAAQTGLHPLLDPLFHRHLPHFRSAATGDFGNLSKVDFRPENTPKV